MCILQYWFKNVLFRYLVVVKSIQIRRDRPTNTRRSTGQSRSTCWPPLLYRLASVKIHSFDWKRKWLKVCYTEHYLHLHGKSKLSKIDASHYTWAYCLLTKLGLLVQTNWQRSSLLEVELIWKLLNLSLDHPCIKACLSIVFLPSGYTGISEGFYYL